MTNHNEAIVEISKKANQFQSSIVLQYDDKYIDVKSILGLFTTLVTQQTFNLHVHGQDAEEAKKVMKDVFEKYKLSVNIVSE